jgi:peptidoglycan/LPS O-acetylase OafA/YrhL
MPNVKHHVNALTGVRAFAAMWVFAFHTWIVAGMPQVNLEVFRLAINVTPLLQFGWIGLDVFFTLSGFLLTRQATIRATLPAHGVVPHSTTLVGEPYVKYLSRRILRVFPAYYFCITIIALLTVNGIYDRVPGKLEMLLHLTMTHNVVEKYIATMNGVFWTMPFEFSFYLVFPLLYVFGQRQGGLRLYLLALAVVVATKVYVLLSGDGYPQVFLLVRLDEFVAGMCAGMYAVSRRIGRSHAAGYFWIGLGLLLATPWVFASYPGVGNYYDLQGFARPLWIQLAVCGVLLGLAGDRHRGVWLFDNLLAVWLGLISYSIYLYHAPLLQLLPIMGLVPSRALEVQPSWRHLFAIAIPVTIAISAASYYWVELPFQRAGRARNSARLLPLARKSFSISKPILILLFWGLALLLLI